MLNNGSSPCQAPARTTTPGLGRGRCGAAGEGALRCCEKVKSPSTLRPPPQLGWVMQQAGGNEAFSGLLEPWGRGSVWGGLVSVPGGSCCSRGVGLARILQLPPILHPAAFGSRSRPAPGTAAVPGELSFLGQLRAAGSSQLPLPALLGTVGGGFPAVRGDVAPPPGGCGRGELSPRSPSAHPDGRWGSLLPWQEHCQAPPVKLIAPGVAPLSQASCAGWHQPVQRQDPAFPCGTPGSQGRCGAAGGRDAASTCLHSDQRGGGEWGNFPDSFPHLKGKKKIK